MLTPKRKSVFMEVSVKDLVLDKNIQMRATLNRIAIADYADEMAIGTKFPPIEVYWMPGQPKYVADGFHRVMAVRKLHKDHPQDAKWKTIRAKVRTGSKRDAMLFAAGANRSHGVRRTADDKRKTVLTFLGDKTWREWNNAEIARHAGVSEAMIRTYRKYLGEGAKASVNGYGEEVRMYVDNKGQTRERVVPEKPDTLEKQLKGELCPYCGQRMPGNRHRVRGTHPGRKTKQTKP